MKLEQSCKKEVAVKTRLISEHSGNVHLFGELLDDFEKKLKEQFFKIINLASIGEVKQDLVASWLANCSMKFRM